MLHTLEKALLCCLKLHTLKNSPPRTPCQSAATMLGGAIKRDGRNAFACSPSQSNYWYFLYDNTFVKVLCEKAFTLFRNFVVSLSTIEITLKLMTVKNVINRLMCDMPQVFSIMLCFSAYRITVPIASLHSDYPHSMFHNHAITVAVHHHFTTMNSSITWNIECVQS